MLKYEWWLNSSTFYCGLYFWPKINGRSRTYTFSIWWVGFAPFEVGWIYSQSRLDADKKCEILIWISRSWSSWKIILSKLKSQTSKTPPIVKLPDLNSFTIKKPGRTDGRTQSAKHAPIKMFILLIAIVFNPVWNKFHTSILALLWPRFIVY